MNENEINELREKLGKLLKFPTVYMFKFIFEADNRKVAQIESFFDEKSTVNIRQSSRNHYLSITVKMPANNIEEIMDIYRKVSSIEGILYL